MRFSKNQWLLILGCGFLTLIIIMMIALYHRSHASPKDIDKSLSQYAQQHHIPKQGESDAKHHMYVFTDFKCTHCFQFHERTYQETIKPFIEQGDVAYTEIQLPVVHQQSHQYAQMMRAISKTGHNDIFYRYSDEAYQHQGIDKDPVTVLKRLHLDQKDEQNIIDAYHKHEDDEIDTKEIKDRFNTDSTPTVFIDGRPVRKIKDIKPKLEN